MIEIQLVADGELPLLDAIRRAAAGEGCAWSRRKVRDWIAAGHVRSDDEVVRDPRRVPPAGARVDLAVPTHPAGLGAAGEAAASAPLPVLHLDRHLLVVEVPPAAPEENASDPLARTLERLGLVPSLPQAPWRLPPRAWPCHGLVVAALTPRARDAVEAAVAAGTVTFEVAGVEGALTLDALGRRAASASPDRPLRVEAVRLPHPRHERPLAFALDA